MKKTVFTLALLLLLGGIIYQQFPCKDSEKIITTYDTIYSSNTIIEHDTLYLTQFVPIRQEVVRIDSVYVNDTIFVPIPIEQKVYLTKDYRAVIEGYKANLLSLEIYREQKHTFDSILVNQSTTITKYKRPRLTLSIGPGIGYDGRKLSPFIGIHAGWVIWSK